MHHYRLHFTCSDLLHYHDWINRQRHAGHSHHHHLILNFYGITYTLQQVITHLTFSKLQRISYNSLDNQNFLHQNAYGEWLMISLQHYQLTLLFILLLPYHNCLSMISLEYAQVESESSYQNRFVIFFMLLV